MTNPVASKSVLETILDWSVTRPAWQRDALRRIIAAGTPESNAISEILLLCKKEHGEEGISLVAAPLDASHLPANPTASASISLASLGQVVGVNQLAAGQTMQFETSGLTVIYGQNGAGKSGYGRILKRACRARKSGQIMPDAFNPAPTGKASAEITLHKDGIADAPLAWIDADQPHPVMSAINVFDKDCASVHIQGKNEVAFRPFGLDIPDDLAGVCIKLKDQLTAEQRLTDQRRDPCFVTPTWSANTQVGKIMAALNVDATLDTLKSLAIVSESDQARHNQLTQDLAKNPVEAAAEQRLIADGINQLALLLGTITSSHSDTNLIGLKAQVDAARTMRATANVAATAAFSGKSLAGVGTEPWKALWESARTFAEQTANQKFPPVLNDPCVLCHQPIDSTAQKRMSDFEAFILDDTETKAATAERTFSVSLKQFNEQKIDTRVVDPIIKRIAISDKDFANNVTVFIESARTRGAECVASLEIADALTLTAFAASPLTKLKTLETETRNYAAQLDKAADVEGRKVLLAELAEITDRLAASALIPKADAEIARLRSLSVLRKAIADTTTNAITKLGNDIADNIITPKMRDRFQSEIVRLAADKVRVEVVRSGGQFGSPQYQVKLFANQAAKVHEVLSEGEQTCVALAAFLTELATAAHKSALIFDDPVTSLDHLWRKKVAERLVAEASERQIIVFTHDLVFVNDLHDLAVRGSAKVKMLSLSRGATGTGIVSDGLPWAGAKISARIDSLEKEISAAKKLYEANDEDSYRNSASQIYGRLRATWERCLEDIVFAGVIHRHRDYLDTKNLKKVVILVDNDVVIFRDAFKKCSDIIESHDPSRARDAQTPTPMELSADIKTLKDWMLSLRDRQNQIA